MCSTGGSAWTTSVTSSTWMPRAAMSVATRVEALPEWKASMLRVRAPWPRLPCSSTVGTPLLLSWRASALAPCLVRVKTISAAGRAGQVDQDRHPVLAVDVKHVVAHRRDRRLRRVGLVGDRVVQELLDQGVDRLVEGGREQQALAALRGAAEDPAYGGQEAEVGHVVGLVEHGDLDVVEGAVSLADQVLEPARAGDDDVDALAEGRDLRVLADAAEDGAGGQAGGLGERREGRLDLADQLTGRGEDQGAGRTTPGRAAVGQSGDQREQERVGLAGAGAAPAEHVAAGEGVGQGRGLDGGRGVDALTGEDGGQACGHAEGFERGQGRALSVRCLTDSRGPKVSGGYARSRPELSGCCYDVRTTRGESSTS